MRSALLCLAVLLLASSPCRPAPEDRSAEGADEKVPSTTAGDAEPLAPIDLLEAIFRYQFGHNDSALQQAATAYCLSLGPDRPVPAELVRRFAGHEPPVNAEPGCPAREGMLTFRINSVRWLSENEVEAVGGYFEGNLSSSTEGYRVVREGERWVVKERRLLVIS